MGQEKLASTDDIISIFDELFLKQIETLFPEPDPRMRIKSPCKERQTTLNQVLNGCVVNDETGCWEWQGASTKKGYGRVKISRKLYSPHRVVAWAMGHVESLSDPERTACVLHRCDNPKCVNPDHLFVGTLADNMQDCSRKGRIANQKNPWRPKQPRKKKTAIDDPPMIRTRRGKWVLTPCRNDKTPPPPALAGDRRRGLIRS